MKYVKITSVLIVLVLIFVAVSHSSWEIFMMQEKGNQEKKIGYDDTPIIPGTKWHVHDGNRPQPQIVTPGTFDIELLNSTVAVEKNDFGLPHDFSLFQNYPNPFNPSTTIEYRVMRQQHVNLSIYNMRGQKIKTLVDDIRAAGTHTIRWNGRDEIDIPVPSGVYLCTLVVDAQRQTRKMVLMQ